MTGRFGGGRDRRPSGRSPRRLSGRSARYSRAPWGTTPVERLLILVLAAAIVGVLAGLLLPRISPQIGAITGRYAATGEAADRLSTLKVADDPRPAAQYDRDAFGFRSTDADGDGCDVREAVLKRDMTDVTTTPGGCKVNTGLLADPYTGRIIRFMRGAGTSAAVQIDHVVALENAWKSGASDWSAAKRIQFGNDPYNLLAVDGQANEDKGSASAAYWLPENRAYRCAYVARQIGVKAKYGLSVTGTEKRAMMGVLHGCPGQTVPED
ncbi:HNH endonuclease family protein [Bifidobacterium vespertilionis]|uniref:HNH endonuclease family protein n=1 Tax=Bifidobacterium vespertilionis TaxID=2562524 RepID=UPI001BDC0B27|nr:HNH endonuclease [Bifidobacterium vespertilionis]